MSEDQSPRTHGEPPTQNNKHHQEPHGQDFSEPQRQTQVNTEDHRREDHQNHNRGQSNNQNALSPQKQIVSSHSQSPEQKNGDHRNRSKNGSFHNKYDLAKISAIPGFVLDELTEFAMAKEGIDLDDLVPKPYEDFLHECNGNQKLAQIRYEYKEGERQALLQDIENRKKIIQLELANESNYNTLSPDSKLNAKMYATHQPSLMGSKLSKMSQSHAQLSMNAAPLHNLRGMERGSSKKQVDNKIFENMLRNQVEQEMKLKSIQERQEMFLMKSYQMQEKRQRDIMKKQEMMHLKQLQKEQKLKQQEELQQKWQMETLNKLKFKSEITESRQQKFKQELKKNMQVKEEKKEMKRRHAQEMYNQYLEMMQEKQKEFEQKNHEFIKKQEQKQRQQKDIIMQKKVKKEQILQSVQEQRDSEEQKKFQRFMEMQMIEMEKERRIEEEKRRQQENRQKKGQEKTERLIFKVEEAYKKMQEWQEELERREKAAADNLKKQQQILAEKLQIKREMKRLRQESAMLKQKRKENKEKMRNDEMMQKLQSMHEKMEQFKNEKQFIKKMKQQDIFKAEQKRADMKTAFYHMAVWNVQEAGDIIKEILDENDKANLIGVKPKSVAEKVREKAAKIRRDERLGLSRISPKGYEQHMNFISEEEDQQELDYMRNPGGHQQTTETEFERAQSSEQPAKRGQANSKLETQKVIFDTRQQH